MFTEYVRDGAMTVPQAIRAVEDIFFTTSNDLYDLDLPLKPLPLPAHLSQKPDQKLLSAGTSDLQALTKFIEQHPTTKFLRLQWLDYTSTPRMRVVPIKRTINMLQKDGALKIGITLAALGLLQNDVVIPNVSIAGVYYLVPDFSSIFLGPTEGFASVYGSFRNRDGSEAALCPRSTLEHVLAASFAQGLDFLIGFEIEIVFMSRDDDGKLITLSGSDGHAWSASRALHDPKILIILAEIYDTLSAAGIYLEQFHSESSSGQYEFVLPPYSPLVAADTLLHTREIIFSVVARHGMRATLFPKPFPMMAGTASHVHMSISSPGGDKKEVYESFYAGVLKHMRAIIAFTYGNPASYDRMVDGCWAGGRWVTWGYQNKETALRAIEGSHFELKVLDGLANVYLALAAILGAGAKGIKDKEVLKQGDCRKDPALLTADERKELGIEEMLPADLEEALKALKEDGELVTLIGEQVVERYVKTKEAEMKLLARMGKEERRTWLMERY